jgi:hypothetical protein
VVLFAKGQKSLDGEAGGMRLHEGTPHLPLIVVAEVVVEEESGEGALDIRETLTFD